MDHLLRYLFFCLEVGDSLPQLIVDKHRGDSLGDRYLSTIKTKKRALSRTEYGLILKAA